MKHKSITVLTLTRGRPQLIGRCIASVRQQNYPGFVRHLILIDDCEETLDFLGKHYQPSEALLWLFRPRAEQQSSGPPHLAKLRNLLVRAADTPWIGFLDDDNVYEPCHLDKLMQCAQQYASPAVHSWVKLFNFDGTPYLQQRWPWCRRSEEGAQRYQEMAKRGVIAPHSNVLKDSIHNLPHRCVDTSTWLIERKLLLDHPIPCEFSYQEWIDNKAEDDKLQMQLMSLGVPIACNKLASVLYYLGGYSTNHDGQHSHSQRWVWQDNV